jgi:hypothetical protein
MSFSAAAGIREIWRRTKMDEIAAAVVIVIVVVLARVAVKAKVTVTIYTSEL